MLLLEARAALRAHGLSDADRADLEQLVVIAALRRFHTYREAEGTVRQWIRGIARNEVRALRRREPGTHVELDEEASASPTATPEEAASRRELLDHLLEQIPIGQRRVVVLVEMWGLTIREAAAVLRSSPTRAHARHRAGMDALREAAERWRREQKSHGLVALPLAPEALFAAARPDEAPAEGDERAWRFATAALALDDAPANDNLARSHEPPMRDGAARWMRISALLLLGPLGFVAGLSMARPPLEHTEAPATMIVGSPALTAEAKAAQVVAAPPVATAVPAIKHVRARVRTIARSAQETEDQALRAERAVIDRARTAFFAKDMALALDALAEHARRFPNGQSAGTRERLWKEACDEAGTDARCAGRR